MKTLSASPVGNYYLYSFDGKLLQTYNVYGVLLKDYIYMGDRLIAEYDHVGSRYLYYTPDQINSTRVVTDDAGTVVYSAAHDPYGGIQQTWVNTFDPTPKFSGKERDEESQLDYFGARYYDRSQHRFISADSITSSADFILEPHKWNLYSYCRNSPIAFVDPTGEHEVHCTVLLNILPHGHAVSDTKINAVGDTIPLSVQVILQTDLKGRQHLVAFLTFEVTIEAKANGKMGGSTFSHEMQHVTDVAFLLEFRLWKIERDFNKRRIKWGDVQKRVYDSVVWARNCSKTIWDFPFLGDLTTTARDAVTYGDPFMYWTNFWGVFDMYLTIRNTSK
jgi:RHS repeat-associated protein